MVSENQFFRKSKENEQYKKRIVRFFLQFLKPKRLLSWPRSLRFLKSFFIFLHVQITQRQQMLWSVFVDGLDEKSILDGIGNPQRIFYLSILRFQPNDCLVIPLRIPSRFLRIIDDIYCWIHNDDGDVLEQHLLHHRLSLLSFLFWSCMGKGLNVVFHQGFRYFIGLP